MKVYDRCRFTVTSFMFWANYGDLGAWVQRREGRTWLVGRYRDENTLIWWCFFGLHKEQHGVRWGILSKSRMQEKSQCCMGRGHIAVKLVQNWV